jgi:topoisomerase-4 subunit B
VVRVWPDAKYFESAVLPLNELTHLLRSKAVLMPGVSVTLVNEKTKDTQTWQFKGGLRDYLQQTLNGEPVIPLFEGEGAADAGHDSFAEGEGAAWAVAFTEDGSPCARELRQPHSHVRQAARTKAACATGCSRPSRVSSSCTACCPKA